MTNTERGRALFPNLPPVAPRAGEIILDSFAGGGGASTGIEIALGRSPDVAINHDPEAVALHTVNHPLARHFCQNVWQVDPLDACGGRPIGAAWFSPDCKHFSKAKGGKPRSKKIRDLAWIVVAYARLPAHLRPRVIFLENVEEFQTWGPLDADGQPDPDRRGETFVRWMGELRRYGYRVQWKEMRACDYGAPTIRKRLFLIARCDGLPIVWPEPTHGAPDSAEVLAGRRLPWRTAAEILDWSIPCPSIFLTPEEARAIGVKRPLAEATMRRIFRGLDRYVLSNPNPFIVRTDMASAAARNGVHGVDEPVRTMTTADSFALVTPFVSRQFGGSVGHDLNDPAGTTTAGGGGKSVLVTPYLTKFRNGCVGSGIEKPVHTVTCSHSDYHPGGAAPIGVVMPWMVQQNTGVVGHGVDEPVSTVLHTGSHQMLAAAHIMTMRNAQKPFNGADEPTHTVTAGGAGLSLVAGYLSQLHGANQGNAGDATRPLGAVLASGFHHAEVRAFLVKYFGSADHGQDCRDPLHTATSKPRFGLVTVQGQEYALVDIGMRMLAPRELFRAQGFPESYQIAIEVNGRPLSKAAQVRMCGNSVCPPIAAAIVGANVPELAVERRAAE